MHFVGRDQIATAEESNRPRMKRAKEIGFKKLTQTSVSRERDMKSTFPVVFANRELSMSQRSIQKPRASVDPDDNFSQSRISTLSKISKIVPNQRMEGHDHYLTTQAAIFGKSMMFDQKQEDSLFYASASHVESMPAMSSELILPEETKEILPPNQNYARESISRSSINVMLKEAEQGQDHQKLDNQRKQMIYMTNQWRKQIHSINRNMATSVPRMIQRQTWKAQQRQRIKQETLRRPIGQKSPNHFQRKALSHIGLPQASDLSPASSLSFLVGTQKMKVEHSPRQ